MKRFAVAALMLSLAVVSGSAFADSRNYGYGYGPRYDMARVTNVSPIFEQAYPVQRQECWYEPARTYSDQGYYYNGRYYNDRYQDRYGRNYPDHGNNTTGAVVGALIGGALGNQVGKGDGRKAATVAGAVLGAAIGNNAGSGRAATRYQNRNDYYANGTVQHCRTVIDYRQQDDERVVGYNVTYRYAGRTYHTTTAYHPGSTLRVRVD